MRLATLAVFFSLFLATAMPSSGQSTDLGQSAAAISPHTIREYSLPPDKLEKAREALRAGGGILRVARQLGLGTGTVHKLKRELT